MTATNRLGKFARISEKRFSMVRKPLAMHHSSAARSACWRPSSCQRFSAADSKYSSERISPNRADSISLRFSAPPSVSSAMSAHSANADEYRES